MHRPILKPGPPQVTPELKALFDPGDPASLRCFAVLEGNLAGRFLADNSSHPAWGIVQEAAHGTIYLGGVLDASLVSEVVATLREDSDVLVGLWHGDRRLDLLPSHPDYIGATLEFVDRPGGGAGLAAFQQLLPEGCAVRRIDHALFERCLWRDDTVAAFGSVERFLERGLGYCLMRGDEILCEAYAGPGVMGLREVGVLTHEAYRGQGYATIACAYLIELCETTGYQTYWNCAKTNLASAALARRLGYHTEREYKLVAWFRSKSE